MSDHDNGLTIDAARACIEKLRDECDRLHEALDSHDTIWRAKAWMTRALSITPDEAHELLWRESNDTNTRVAEIARRVIDEHESDSR